MDGMEQLTNKELAQMCREAGLPDYGTKEKLIARLQKMAAEVLTEQPAQAEPEQPYEAALTQEPAQPADMEVQPEPIVELVAEPEQQPEPNAPVVMPAVIGKVSRITALPENLPPVNHAAHVQDTLDSVRGRFQGLNIQYDSNEEMFIFSGGRQGRLTTTARQPKRSIMLVAESYFNFARGRAKTDIGELA